MNMLYKSPLGTFLLPYEEILLVTCSPNVLLMEERYLFLLSTCIDSLATLSSFEICSVVYCRHIPSMTVSRPDLGIYFLSLYQVNVVL